MKNSLLVILVIIFTIFFSVKKVIKIRNSVKVVCYYSEESGVERYTLYIDSTTAWYIQNWEKNSHFVFVDQTLYLHLPSALAESPELVIYENRGHNPARYGLPEYRQDYHVVEKLEFK